MPDPNLGGLDVSTLRQRAPHAPKRHNGLEDYLRFIGGVLPAAGMAVGGVAQAAGVPMGAEIGKAAGQIGSAAPTFAADYMGRDENERGMREQDNDTEEAARNKRALEMMR